MYSVKMAYISIYPKINIIIMMTRLRLSSLSMMDLPCIRMPVKIVRLRPSLKI